MKSLLKRGIDFLKTESVNGVSNLIDDSIQVLPDSSKRVLKVHMYAYVNKHRLSIEPTKSKWIVRSYPDNEPVVWCISEDVLTAIGTVVDYIHENNKDSSEMKVMC